MPAKAPPGMESAHAAIAAARKALPAAPATLAECSAANKALAALAKKVADYLVAEAAALARVKKKFDDAKAALDADLGQVPDAAVFADGSGLSKQNRLTPGLLVVAMVQASRGKAGPVLRACLPVAGQSGTLTDRFVGTDLVGRVRAKTGWIRGASALSGLVEGKDGRVRWFSILMNYDPKVDGLNKDLKQLQEQIVRAIDTLDAR